MWWWEDILVFPWQQPQLCNNQHNWLLVVAISYCNWLQQSVVASGAVTPQHLFTQRCGVNKSSTFHQICDRFRKTEFDLDLSAACGLQGQWRFCKQNNMNENINAGAAPVFTRLPGECCLSLDLGLSCADSARKPRGLGSKRDRGSDCSGSALLGSCAGNSWYHGTEPPQGPIRKSALTHVCKVTVKN